MALKGSHQVPECITSGMGQDPGKPGNHLLIFLLVFHYKCLKKMRQSPHLAVSPIKIGFNTGMDGWVDGSGSHNENTKICPFFLHDFTVQFSYVSHSHQGGNVRAAHGGETDRDMSITNGPDSIFFGEDYKN